MDDVYTENDINIFHEPARIIVAGFSNSGKTVLVTRLIKQYSVYFSKIFICGVKYHPLQEDETISPKLKVSKEIVDSLEDANPRDKILLILDDMYLEAIKSPRVVNAFIKGRHSNLSVILITQNLFMRGAFSRDISLNATHFLLLRMRDLAQVECLMRQIYGKKQANYVLEIYKRAVINKPYGYLLLDMAIKTPSTLKFRSNIAGESPCEVVYIHEEVA